MRLSTRRGLAGTLLHLDTIWLDVADVQGAWRAGGRDHKHFSSSIMRHMYVICVCVYVCTCMHTYSIHECMHT